MRFTRRARFDLSGVQQWLSQPGAGTSAQLRLNRLVAALVRLQTHPLAGRPGNHPGTRRLIVGEHVVIYRLVPNTTDPGAVRYVSILRVFGPGQDTNKP